MRNAVKVILAITLLSAALPVLAQQVYEPLTVLHAAPTGSCVLPTNNVKVDEGSSQGIYQCILGTWTLIGPGSGSFTAAGDLSGSASSQQVVGLLGHALPTLAAGYPNWNGTAWVFSTPSASLPSGTAGQLVFYQASGTTVVPLTLGTNLSITGTTLNASSSGATAWSAITSGANAQTGAFSTAAPWTFNVPGAASTPGLSITGAPATGSTTTSFGQLLVGNGGTMSALATGGTEFMINCGSGITNAYDQHNNGGASVGSLTCTGAWAATRYTIIGGTISLLANTVGVGSTSGVLFGSSASYSSPDVGWDRSSAGVIHCNNGTIGTEGSCLIKAPT